MARVTRTQMAHSSEITARSKLFGACVSLGLVVSWLEGVSGLEIAQTALVACVLFLGFMVGEAGLGKYQRWAIRRRFRGR